MFKRRLEHKIKDLEGMEQLAPVSKGLLPSLHQQEDPEQEDHADQVIFLCDSQYSDSSLCLPTSCALSATYANLTPLFLKPIMRIAIKQQQG